MTELPSALYFFILLGVSEIGLALVKRSHTGKSDGGSLGLLWGVILTGILAGGLAALGADNCCFYVADPH